LRGFTESGGNEMMKKGVMTKRDKTDVGLERNVYGVRSE